MLYDSKAAPQACYLLDFKKIENQHQTSMSETSHSMTSSGGALISLLSKNAADAYNIDNSTTLWTNKIIPVHEFAMETVELCQWAKGAIQFGSDAIMTNLVSEGDMLHKLTLEIAPFAIPTDASLVKGWPRIMVQEATLKVGDAQFTTYGRFMQVLLDLNHGTGESMRSMACMDAGGDSTDFVYVDLPFFFDKHANMGLPTVHTVDDIELSLKLAPTREFLVTKVGKQQYNADISTTFTSPSIRLLGTFVMLPTAHVATLLAQPQELVIETHHLAGEELDVNTSMVTVELSCKHCTKELIICIHADNMPSTPHLYAREGHDLIKDRLHCERVRLVLDNQHREYYPAHAMHHAISAPLAHHTHSPLSGVMCMPFCSKPDSMQPTGTLNFGRFAFKHLHIHGLKSGPTYSIRVYALQYELLHIIKGRHKLYDFMEVEDRFVDLAKVGEAQAQ